MQRGFLLAAAEKTEKKKSEKKSEPEPDQSGVAVTSSVGYRVEKEPGIKILKFDSDVDVNLSDVDGMLKVFAKPCQK
ncbi:unnamed protein product [Symbiodinium necroappetens]|uniref:Uncharacterized protein n=1 Tax=Symbiodinium necroappetens TaxID=1628268 RepID=A0A813BJX0_9DINO|nr:unnamed protein product [Symbiodinium necroappetens]